jgi:hypothetical protein
MTTTASAVIREVEIFRHQARIAHNVVKTNLNGLTHEDSLIQPQPNGNCLNWVLGHLVCVYDRVLPSLQQRPVLGMEALKRYDRGTPPLRDSSEALELPELIAAWNQAAERIDAGLSNLKPEVLDTPVPRSPTNNPNETVRSLLSTTFFHQAYHAGQTGILRRIAGKEGAIP